MAESQDKAVDRRNFLKIAAGSAAALVAGAEAAAAKESTPPAPDPTAPSKAEVLTTNRTGSDFMVDVIKKLGFEYICANPGSSFRGLQESVINYGNNKNPEFITCCHEESSIAMAHGYYKIEGRPLLVFAHGTVGLQHGAMAIYNAFCDRVPVYIIIGNTIDATMRRPGVEWDHSVQDAAAMVRDYVKWDDLPISLGHFAESAVRAYKVAMTPPMEPVLLVADTELQERPVDKNAKVHIPKLTMTTPPQGDSGAVAEAAKMLVAAENPVIIADRTARTAAGMQLLLELAETLQAPVINESNRMNFPSRHPLNHTDRRGALVRRADVILALEVADVWGLVHSYRDQLYRSSRRISKPNAKVISITASELYIRSNYQDFQRYPELDIAIAADSEATLPGLIEQVKRRINAGRRRELQDRGTKLAAGRRQIDERARVDASYAWNASPISMARVAAELWNQIKDKDWSLVSPPRSASNWPLRLWEFEKYYQCIGGPGGAGVGYCAPASLGAALANRKHGRLSVSIQNDGDLMYAPGILWTSAHHRIPLLSVMHNNRAYHQELMHIQRMASRHNRGLTTAHIGTTLEDPNIDYAKLAQGLGVFGQGPITDPKDLGPALRRAIEVVQRGEPALVDVVTQPR